MVRLSRKYHSGKWTLPLLAWCTSADPAIAAAASGTREIYRADGAEPPRLHISKDKKIGKLAGAE